MAVAWASQRSYLVKISLAVEHVFSIRQRQTEADRGRKSARETAAQSRTAVQVTRHQAKPQASLGTVVLPLTTRRMRRRVVKEQASSSLRRLSWLCDPASTANPLPPSPLHHTAAQLENQVGLPHQLQQQQPQREETRSKS